MKTTLLSLSLLMAGAGLMAQPTLNSGNTNPLPGESFLVHATTTFTPGNAGANVNWDFSNLPSNSVSSYTCALPSSTGHAADFPKSSIVYLQNNLEDYFVANSSSFGREGAYLVSNGVVQKAIYSDPEDIIHYPMNFNDSFVDSIIGESITNGTSIDRNGNCKVTADAHGTLKLPYGTLNNVIRLKIEENYEDSYMSNVIGEYVSTIYMWFKPGVHAPVLSLTTATYNGGSTTVEYGTYLDQSAVGLDDKTSNIASVLAFPNPCKESLTIQFSLHQQSFTKVSISNILGQEQVVLAEENYSAGSHQLKMNREKLPAGIYFLRVESDGKSFSQKIILD